MMNFHFFVWSRLDVFFGEFFRVGENAKNPKLVVFLNAADEFFRSLILNSIRGFVPIVGWYTIAIEYIRALGQRPMILVGQSRSCS